jgi:DNA-directed RNA polymerase specialized sigma24 family protein
VIANRNQVSNQESAKSESAAAGQSAESDRTLTLRAQGGDAAAMLALVDRYAAPLYNLALRTTGDAAGSAEVVTEVLAVRLRGLSEKSNDKTTSPSPYPPPSRGRGEEETATASPSNAGGFKSEERWIVPLAADLYRAILEAGFRPERRTAGLRISTRHWNAAGLRLADGEGRGGRRTAQRLRRRLAHAWSHLAMQQRFVLTLSETQNLSPAELARVLGQNETAAQKLRDEAKLALLALLARPERRSWLRRRREEDES